MIIDINARCRIKSDAYQWIAHRKNNGPEKGWHIVGYYRTLNYALDELKNPENQLCTEAEVTNARAIAARIKDANRRIDALLGGRRDIPIPPAVAAYGSFMTAAGGINYGLLKQVWQAETEAEIGVLIENAVAFAEGLLLERAACNS